MKNIDKNIDIDELIAGHCSNELSAEETGYLRDWLNASSDNKNIFSNKNKSGFLLSRQTMKSGLTKIKHSSFSLPAKRQHSKNEFPQKDAYLLLFSALPQLLPYYSFSPVADTGWVQDVSRA